MSLEHSSRFAHDGELVKVAVNLPPSDWHAHALESFWAKPIGYDRYQLQNVPFYASGLSFDDVVIAREVGGQLIVQSVEHRGGHSTYRIYLLDDVTITSKAFLERWSPLAAIGATFEQANEQLLAVDIPETADIYQAYALLEAGEQSGTWDFQEGHCGHRLRE